MNYLIESRGRQLKLSAPVVMGILNVTPDSFSDGGHYAMKNSGAGFRLDLDSVLRVAEQMQLDGATIVDVGGESTRPGARPVSLEQELERVMPAIERIAANIDVLISVDTSSPEVMTAAASAGAFMINDVRALQNPGALQSALNSGLAVCLMHMRGEPDTMQSNTHYVDVIDEVIQFLEQRVAVANSVGIASSRLVVDPGFGFGKAINENYRLLDGLQRFHSLGLPLLVGMSRKSMIGQATGRPVEQRLAGGIAVAGLALERGAAIIRTHDVAATMDAIGVHCQLEKSARGTRQT